VAGWLRPQLNTDDDRTHDIVELEVAFRAVGMGIMTADTEPLNLSYRHTVRTPIEIELAEARCSSPPIFPRRQRSLSFACVPQHVWYTNLGQLR
jgi:hypothetical protein